MTLQLSFDVPQRLFTDPAYWSILRPILLHALDDHRSLSLLCKNVRHLLATDPDIRDRFFHIVYGLPVAPPSLDITSGRTEAKVLRTAGDTESYLREHALQRFAPSLVRCVHLPGQVAAMRDGYMVSYIPAPPAPSSDPAAPLANKSTGWTVWYLPQWHDVRKAYNLNRDMAKTPRGDPLLQKDIPLSPCPAYATNDQQMWKWDFELGAVTSAIAIHPQDNLLAVVTLQPAVRYSVTTDPPSLVGRRHRVYFFQLRPRGLAIRGDPPHSTTPVRHPEAACPYVDLLEPVPNPHAPQPGQHYALKIGPHGKIGLLVQSKDGAERSGPLAIWNWRQGECVGYFPPREGKSNFLDFDWYTTKHIMVLEASSPPPPAFPVPSNSTPRAIPFKLRLMALRIGSGSFPVNSKIVVPLKSTATGSDATVHAPNTWISTDLRQARNSYLLMLDLPPTLDRTLRMSPQQLPLATLVGQVSAYPSVSDRYFLGSLTFSIGCKRFANGTTSPSVVRGSLPSALLASLVPFSVKIDAVKTAINQWLHYAQLPPTPYSSETIRRKFNDAITQQTAAPSHDDRGVLWDEAFLDDFRLCFGADIFASLVATADQPVWNRKRDSAATGKQQGSSLSEVLGGENGIKAHAAAFSRFLPVLSTNAAGAEGAPLPFDRWCPYADFFITPSGQRLGVHGARVVYVDQDGASLAGKKLKADLPAELTDRRCHLVMRNYTLGMLGFPPNFNMEAAQWFWHSESTNGTTTSDGPPGGNAKLGTSAGPGPMSIWKDKVLEPIPASPHNSSRYAKCQGKALHPPWLGAQVLGSAFWEERELPVAGDSESGEAGISSSPVMELRVPLVVDREPIRSVWFDGQTIVLSQADKAMLISF